MTNEKDLEILLESVEFYDKKDNPYFNETLALNYIRKAYDIVNRDNNYNEDVLIKYITLLLRPQNSHKKNIEKAKELIEELRKKSNDSDISLYLLGSLNFKECNFIECISYYEAAILKNPKNDLYKQEYKRIIEFLKKYQIELETILYLPPKFIENKKVY